MPRRVSFILLLILFPVYGFAQKAAAKEVVVVIDAGHGGHDPGCVGKKAREKDITLDVARKLAERINKEIPGIKAVLTRSDDRFLTLQQRANIANQANGNLFISIHVNSVSSDSPGRNTVRGASVYTLGPDKSKNKLSVAMRENSVIELEKDYTRKYRGFDPNSAESYIIFELNQNAYQRKSVRFASIVQRHLVTDAGRMDKGVRQDGFWVLWATKMPAVLVELDFICNPREEEFLNSQSGRDKCVAALFNSIKEYEVRKDMASADLDTQITEDVKDAFTDKNKSI